MSELPWFLGNQWIFSAIVMLVLVGFTEVGYRTGLRLFAKKDEARRCQIGGVQGAMLGLLGLLLGFTFSMAMSRYETRRDMVLQEANAVGTAWLRAGLLPDAQRNAAKELFRRWVDVRLTHQRGSHDPEVLAEGLRSCAEIETALWTHAQAAAKEVPTPITATFIVALNEMIDTAAERITAHRNRIPGVVWVLLMTVAACGCLTTAYGSGAQGARSVFTSFVLPVLITVVIAFIYDLLDVHQGFVSISQEPLLDLQQAMKSEVVALPR